MSTHKAININYHLASNSEKSNGKIYGKTQKKTKKEKRFLAILGPFCPFLNKNGFSPTIGLCQFLDFAIIYHYAKNQKKLMNAYAENYLLTDERQTDKGHFVKLSVYGGPILAKNLLTI